VAAAAVAVLAACALRTWGQLATWRDSRTLWQHAVEVSPGDDAVHDNLGLVYLDEGQPAVAWRLFARAAELNPANFRARNNLGRASLALGDPEVARIHLTEAVRLAPNQADAQYNLALTYVLGPEPDLTAARDHCRRAVELNGALAPAHALLGYLCHESGQAEEGDSHYGEALRLDPGWLKRTDEEAWRLATGGTWTPFKGALALLGARQVCQATGERRAEFLETRAAAEAAAGHHTQAARTLRQLLALVPEGADPRRREAIRERLRLYEQGSR
jgi:tetratricopeptide (TPR) repeat protein